MNCQLLTRALKESDSHLDLVASALNSSQVLKEIAKFHPDVAIISSQLEDGLMAGFGLVRKLRATSPQTRAVMLVESADPQTVANAFRAGAKGIFCRSESVDDLRKCLKAVHKGQIWASSQQIEVLLDLLFLAAPIQISPTGSLKGLTKRELDVTNLVAQGFTNREISEKLQISSHTVKNYLFRIFDKLGISSRVELVLHAARDWYKEAPIAS